MSKGIPDYFSLNKFNISPADMVALAFHCKPSDIRKNVILSPIWSEKNFSRHTTEIETISEGFVYDISYQGKSITYIRSGMGAPFAGDAVLALSCTPCENVIFIGSVGGLKTSLEIGDLVLVNKSICGDGFSNYLKKPPLDASCFLTSTKPNAELSSILEKTARSICDEQGITLSKGDIYSTDTIIAQFPHLDFIEREYDCIGIEMETSAVFNAASLVGLKAAALLQFSDVLPTNKSLFSGRTEQDQERRRHIRSTYITKIVLDTLSDIQIS